MVFLAKGKFVSYLRVSTDRQGKSGLGLEAQRSAVESYLDSGRWKIIKEFVEVESGRRSDRPKLAEALAMCRAHRAALVVAKVDRLARSQSFLSRILEAGVEVRFCGLPQIEGPTGRFLLQSMMAVAELEAGMISARTGRSLNWDADKEQIILKGGHVSLIAGPNAVRRLWPRLDAWLAPRSA